MELERIFVTLLFMATSCLYAQKYTTKTGVVKFEATVPSFEEVAGENKTVSAAFDTGTGDIAVLALMKGFRFKVALMEEHFNENYVESDKFPKATFKGKVEGFDLAKLAAAGGSYTLSGDLTLHGKTKKVTDTAKITKSGDKLVVSGAFEVKPSDFGIEVPAVVSKKVADKISITYSFTLAK